MDATLVQILEACNLAKALEAELATLQNHPHYLLSSCERVVEAFHKAIESMRSLYPSPLAASAGLLYGGGEGSSRGGSRMQEVNILDTRALEGADNPFFGHGPEETTALGLPQLGLEIQMPGRWRRRRRRQSFLALQATPAALRRRSGPSEAAERRRRAAAAAEDTCRVSQENRKQRSPSRRWVHVAQVRPKKYPQITISEELLQVHPSELLRLRGEEAGPAARRRPLHVRGHVLRHPHLPHLDHAPPRAPPTSPYYHHHHHCHHHDYYCPTVPFTSGGPSMGNPEGPTAASLAEAMMITGQAPPLSTSIQLGSWLTRGLEGGSSHSGLRTRKGRR
uniref:Uncharacterized protein n=1 Tax=Ananas comosus var. bracteatus TaxID=296719 RepID=A0A6V7PDG4_ANACO|nr:unnamed protein product [Ananas comosus var. bracteatus]